MKNPYEALGVPSNASIDAIKSAFRRLAKKTHPDLNGGSQQMSAQFREVAEAYSILRDPAQKNQWDALYQEGKFAQQAADKRSSSYYNSVRSTAEEIEFYIHALYEEVKPYKEAAKRSVVVGMAWLIGGLVITFGTYMAAVSSGGGSYVVTWGAIVFGGIQAIRSFSNYVKINNVVAEAEAEMWRAFE